MSETTIAPANEAQQVEFLKAASDTLSQMGVPPEMHQQLITNELAAQATALNLPLDDFGKQSSMEKEVPSPCDALKDMADTAGEATTDKKPVAAKKSIKITVLKKAMAHAKENKGKTPEEKKDEEVMKEIPTKKQGPDVYDGKEPDEKEAAEKIAREALFNSALDHMVNDMRIPEKQAKEILTRQYGEIS